MFPECVLEFADVLPDAVTASPRPQRRFMGLLIARSTPIWFRGAPPAARATFGYRSRALADEGNELANRMMQQRGVLASYATEAVEGFMMRIARRSSIRFSRR
jgi:hypothetical protein